MNYKKFGDLTREEQVKLFEAWLEDENCIVFLSKADVGVWLSCHTPSWSPLNTYRVKETPDSINWDHVHPDFKWMARNSHGKTLLFCNQPKFHPSMLGGFIWDSPFSNTLATDFTSYKQGTVSAENSLVKRPE